MKTVQRTKYYLFLSLLLGSFSDEAVQLIFALNLGNAEQIYLTSLLLMLGMFGGISANTVFSHLAKYLSIQKMIFYCLLAEAVMIMFASFIQAEAAYLLVSFLLGVLGGLLWSAVLIMIPTIVNKPKELEQINKYAHTIRNMGFIVGPALGGGIAFFSDYSLSLFVVGVITFLSAFAILPVAMGAKTSANNSADEQKPAVNGFSVIPLLLKNSQIKGAIAPLVITIICTSALSVLLIVYLTDILKLNAGQYGIFSSVVSLSLAFCPLFLTKPMSVYGDAVGACLSATFIGVALLLLNLTENYILLLLGATLLGGFNGTQNTIMSAFMLKNIAPENRQNYMPAYVLILQLSVLVGFILSMFINADNMAFTFLLLSLLTLFSGVIGAIFNRRMT